MSKVIVTVEEAKKIIHLPKQTATKMEWIIEQARDTNRYRYVTACQVLRTTIAGLFFRCSYKGMIPNIDGSIRVHENMSAGLFFKNNRISSIDYCQSYHKNKIGEGLPFFGAKFNGLHKHIWIQEGDGYAEPINVQGEIDLKTLIEMFCNDNNLTILGNYQPPFIEDQLSLF
ncbi:hypothetical protein [Wohlfahrtiimonas chitiniclastica]|uniref:hypothetical protein n=1 Tax=Wohlfahrtiimonas chitiniclastica TaxID=400946 RepID=UPI001BCEF1BF|nr:hypothetical protein [Wohlfahrtiimonas chitiniclastica]MBS7835202.1 hypothetical protein [Wohlfahrtiimonas chitiniclastica]MBS7836339.1 hypothetical protein [Wohlfahrtiimonas chitiniclastica]